MASLFRFSHKVKVIWNILKLEPFLEDKTTYLYRSPPSKNEYTVCVPAIGPFANWIRQCPLRKIALS